ncbi:trypsin-like peptidase domain-containing protein [Streptomyces sp. TLI_185]|uniref:VMAP-C domain-containing protein n=1 Tax=Streptomyces sp. TLI_185 TaxID=2485151 RepID=UPI001613C185|nr:trypsin-like peptidase domain-containing protein [Streptomyces sp. TLI_185]
MEERLSGLVQDATVKVHGPMDAGDGRSPGIWGSGFFVAPGRVLTCAHVLSELVDGRRVWRGDGEIRITYRTPDGSGEATVAGRLWHCLPGMDEVPEGRRGLWPTPDLAIVELTEHVDHPCVWLSDLSTPPSDSGGWLLYRGFTYDEYGSLSDWEGYCQVAGVHGRYVLRLTGHGGEIKEGLSGGPVVDLGRGAVVGVIKSRRNDRDGGNCVRVTALRALRSAGTLGEDPYQDLILAHDGWHWDAQQRHGADNHTWASVQSHLLSRGRPWRPLDRVQALGLLAKLPPAPDVGTIGKLVDEVCPGQRTSRMERPGAWRDGAGLLYDPFDKREEKAVLGYLVNVARQQRRAAPGPAGELIDWALERARSLRPDEREELARLAAPEPIRIGHAGVRSDAPGGFAADPGPLVHRADAEREEPGADQASDPNGASNGAFDPNGAFGAHGRSGPRRSSRPESGPRPDPEAALTDGSAVVLLEFRGDWWLEGLYSWTVRLMSHTGDVELMAVGQGVPVDGLDRPPPDLADALREVFLQADAGRNIAPLCVVLPQELFDIPVDEWEISRSSRHESAGLGAVRFVSVVDQLSYGRTAPEVRRFSREWPPEDTTPRAVPLLGEYGRDYGLGRGYRDGPGRDPGAPAPVLYHCGPISTGPAADALRVALDAWHAVVLWRRDQAGPEVCERFDRGVRELVLGLRNLGELPAAVAELRATSGPDDPASDWAHGIALLWDDPVLRSALTSDLLDTP